MPAITITGVTTGTDQLTAVAHGLLTGDRFRLRNVGGALPAATPALAGATDYFALRVDADHLKVCDTNAHALAGTGIVDLTGSGSGTTTIEYGLPYCVPTSAAAQFGQIKSANDNGVWAALVALYCLLTGQAQAIWSTIVIAMGVALTANQHFSVSGTGRYKHGTLTQSIATSAIQFTSSITVAYNGSFVQWSGTSTAGLIPITLDVGKRVLAIRVVIKDSATGPTTISHAAFSKVTSAGIQTTIALSGASSGAGTNQTLTITTAETIATATFYQVQLDVVGSASVEFYGAEVDYDCP